MIQQIEWFCYLAVEEGILSQDDCVAVFEAIEEAGVEQDLNVFVQTIVDNELSDEIDRLESLMQRAMEGAEQQPFPPRRLFQNVQAPAATAKPVAKAAPSSQGQGATGAAPATEVGEEITTLVGAENLSDEEAFNFMVQFFEQMREAGASDVHLSANARPFFRCNLENHFFEETPLSPAAAEKLNLSLLNDSQRGVFEERQDLDYSLSISDFNRYRVNLMAHKAGMQGTYHLVPEEVLTLEELGFENPDVIKDLLNHHNGLILVTGPAGSGKTTTLAALVAELNQKRCNNIITVEDPVEIVQVSENCNINQRQIGLHTNTFHSALKAALREDPDIIVIGEMRDLETIEMAITAAETGHLVIGTVHTSDAASTLNRILDVFPPSAQAQIRAMTSESLRGIICQRLLPGVDHGLVLAAEVLIANTAVGNIIRDGRTHQLKGVLQTGTAQGMSTMDDSIFSLFQEELISADVALEYATEANTINAIEQTQFQREAAAAQEQASKGQRKKKGWFK
jgi:twitching motility protein PilT